jgi:hypothetical protein
MRHTFIGIAAVAALLFIFVLGSVQRDVGPGHSAPRLALVSTAEAATATCAVPSLERLPGTWVVRSSRCTDGACARAHLAPGDRLRFERDVSGEANFSVEVLGRARNAMAGKSVGYALRSDGVAGVKGPIVLDQDPRDGNPLDLHWLIVDVRAYDADGFGACKLTGRVQICTSEPAAGASSCGDKQHGGIIIMDPP